MQRQPAPARATAKVQRGAQRAEETSFALGHDDPPPGTARLFAEPLARWIFFVALGVVIVTAVLLAAGVWAKRRILKL